MRDGLIEQTLFNIEHIASKYRRPVLLVSFGKDSMVLLDLMRHFRLPVICHRPPYQSHRWEFADKVIRDYDLTVYNFPPEAVHLQDRDGKLYVMSSYSAGYNHRLMIAQHTAEPVDCDHTVLCGLHDVLKQPVCQFVNAWDLAICAQKNGDPGIGGPMEIELDIMQVPNARDTMFALKDWTDQDIWEYIHKHKVPYHESRYDGSPSEQLANNPDVVSGCFACLRKDGSTSVKCPRAGGKLVNNISDRVPYLDYDNNKL